MMVYFTLPISPELWLHHRMQFSVISRALLDMTLNECNLSSSDKGITLCKNQYLCKINSFLTLGYGHIDLPT